MVERTMGAKVPLSLYDLASRVNPWEILPDSGRVIWKGKNGAFAFLFHRPNGTIKLYVPTYGYDNGLLFWQLDDSKPVFRKADRDEYEEWRRRCLTSQNTEE